MPFEIFLQEAVRSFFSDIPAALTAVFSGILAATAIIGLILTMRKIKIQQDLRQQELAANRPLIGHNSMETPERLQVKQGVEGNDEENLYKIPISFTNFGKRPGIINSLTIIIYDIYKNRYIPRTRINYGTDILIATQDSKAFMVNVDQTKLTPRHLYYFRVILKYIDSIPTNKPYTLTVTIKWFFSGHDTPDDDRLLHCFESEINTIDKFIVKNPITDDIIE